MMIPMVERVSSWIVIALGTYALVGMLFAIAFVTVGVRRVDSGAEGTGVGFRLVILPGSIAFWPLLLRRWISGKGSPPEERNPHR